MEPDPEVPGYGPMEIRKGDEDEGGEGVTVVKL